MSDYVRALPFVTVAIDDAPGPSSDRGRVERGATALLSAGAKEGLVRASDDWLGLAANRATIAASLLWNVNHVADACDDAFLDLLEQHAREMK